jgi:hypothetical protein
VQRYLQLIIKLLAILAMSNTWGCGNAGSSDQSSDGLSGNSTIKGSITTESGGQGDLAGWNVCLLDRVNNFCLTGIVDTAGLFTIKGVDAERIYTLVLMSPAVVFQAVLASPSSEKTGFLNQYFKLTSVNLPRIIHKGSTLSFQNTTGITWDKLVIKDSDADGIPDGMAAGQFSLGSDLTDPWALRNATRTEDNHENIAAESDVNSKGFETPNSLQFNLATAPSKIDTDRDGTPNLSDNDLDGDGVPNVFDADDDGDGIIDVLDKDSNGTQAADTTELSGDSYFPVGVEWVAVNYSLAKQADNSVKKLLTVVTKLRAGISPTAIQLRGPTTLLKNATVESTSASGTAVSTPFDGLLLDDGKNSDGAAKDGYFARTITLQSSSVSTRNMVLMIQLRFGSTEADAKYMEFPYTMAPITLGTIVALHSGSTSLGTFQCCSGSPFGASVIDYSWAVKIYDSTNKLFFASPAQAGATAPTVYTVPSGIWESITGLASGGEKFTFKISANLFDRIPGYAPFNITGKQESLATGY